MTQLPTLPDGRQLSALQVGNNPPRFIYGDTAVLTWLRQELLRQDSSGMPQPQDNPVPWR